MEEFLNRMGSLFSFLFEQLANFVTTILEGTILGDILLFSIFVGLLMLLIGGIFSWITKK